MRALIVGVDGQDGSILWEQLETLDFTLLGLSRNRVRTRGVDWQYHVDITDELHVRKAVADFQPHQIYFLAGSSHSSQDPASCLEDAWTEGWMIHVKAFKAFLDALRQTRATARLFYASSSRVFGKAESPMQDENTPLKPVCLYGITKATAMMLAKLYRETHGLWISCGILYNHESPRRKSDFLSQKVARGLARIKNQLEEHLVVGSLKARADWGYAGDYTRAMRMILACDEPRDFVIATGETHSVGEMIEIAAECLNIDWRSAVIEDASLFQREPLMLCGDSTLLRNLTGWLPAMSFRELIRTMVHTAEQRASPATKLATV